MKTRDELDADLDALAVSMPRFLATTKASHRAEAFAKLAESLEGVATLRDRNHVKSRLRQILEAAGIPPSGLGM